MALKGLIVEITSFVGSGEMATRSGNLLPLSNEPCDTIGGCSLAGDPRADENIALYSMHTLWIREHNRVVKKLRENHKTWSGEKLYQVRPIKPFFTHCKDYCQNLVLPSA